MIIAVDVGARDASAAEHSLDVILACFGRLAPGARLVTSTHVVGVDRHVALTASWMTAASHDADEALIRILSAPVGLESGLVASWPGEPDLVSSGPAHLVGGASEAFAQRVTRSAGRLVEFPGARLLRGRLRVGDLVDASAVDVVEGLAGVPIDMETVVDTGDFVRPVWRDARAVLLVQPTAETGVVAPFESAVQIPCCARH